MNLPASECSSGCESGWTLYLDQSYLSASQCQRAGGIVSEDYERKGANIDDDEEEDLSMVSDASSGPPHFPEDENFCNENGHFFSASSASKSAKMSEERKKIKKHDKKQRHTYLDDTASSPVQSFPKKGITFSPNQPSMEHALDFTQGFSSTRFKGKSAFQKHFGFLQSTVSGKDASEKPGGF